jgi:hypothetical protein
VALYFLRKTARWMAVSLSRSEASFSNSMRRRLCSRDRCTQSTSSYTCTHPHKPPSSSGTRGPRCVGERSDVWVAHPAALLELGHDPGDEVHQAVPLLLQQERHKDVSSRGFPSHVWSSFPVCTQPHTRAHTHTWNCSQNSATVLCSYARSHSGAATSFMRARRARVCCAEFQRFFTAFSVLGVG